MADLIQALGLDAAVASVTDKIQARVGEWLGIPAALTLAASRTQDPRILGQISQLRADYQASAPVVQQGLQVAQAAAQAHRLPALDQLPVLVTAATAIASATDTARKIARATGAVEVGTRSPATWPKAVAWGAAALLFGGALVYAARRRRRRRSRR